ncbi:MAG: hypothetical protein ACOC0D_10035, partial [Spirochaeta sp.]
MQKQKLPKIARKSYSPAQFRKKVTGKLFLPQDRDFLQSMFKEQPDGRLQLQENPDPKDLKRLQRLSKAIAKNRGVLRIGRLAIPAAVAAGLLIFSLVWQDRLIAQALQKGLQYVFQARAEVTGLRLSVFSGSIDIEKISVADQARPMQNLFEAENLRFDVDLPALLQRKLIISDMQIENIRHGTARSMSGELSRTAQSEATEVSESAPSLLQDFTLPQLDASDAADMVQEYAESLTVTGSIRQAQEYAEQTLSAWAERMQEYRRQTADMESTVREVMQIDPRNLTTIDEILAARDSMQAAIEEASQLQEQAGNPLRQAAGEIGRAQGYIDAAGEGFEQDLQMLQQQIGAITSDPFGIVTGIAASFLSDTGQERLREIRTGYQRFKRLQNLRTQVSAQESPDEPARIPRGGIEIAFPNDSLPGLHIRRAFSSFSTSDSLHELEIQDLSSNPRLIGAAPGFSYDYTSGITKTEIYGSLPLEPDSASEQESPAMLSVRNTGVPLHESRDTGPGGVIELQGITDLHWDTRLYSVGRFEVEANIRIEDARVNIQGGSRILSELLTEAVEQAGVIILQLQIQADNGEIQSVRSSTNLDALLADGMRRILDRQRTAMIAAVEAELRELVARERQRLEPYEQQLEELQQTAQEMYQQIQEYQTQVVQTRELITDEIGSLDQTRAELENRLR